ncbi:MAG: hypothetical protein K8E66_01555, partial [Phycisphaerales bacterium]|nr:hypothetical protein [Phycisphaerales bacterium]
MTTREYNARSSTSAITALNATVEFVCSQTGRPFVVNYERRTVHEDFCVESARALSTVSSGGT